MNEEFAFELAGLDVAEAGRFTAKIWADLAFDEAALKRAGVPPDGLRLTGSNPFAFREADNGRITDLHVWRVEPGAHAVIVSVTGDVDSETVRSRLAPVHELAHVTVEAR